MKSRDPELLKRTVKNAVGMALKFRSEDFLDQLKLQSIEVLDAYFDTHDGKPVTIMRVHTHPTAARTENNHMHSGALMVIVDHLSTFGSMAEPSLYDEVPEDADPDEVAHMKPEILQSLGQWFGVSRNIKLHVQRPTPVDSDVRLEVKVLENAPSSAYLQIKAYDNDGNLLFTGSHDKIKLRKKIKPKL